MEGRYRLRIGNEWREGSDSRELMKYGIAYLVIAGIMAVTFYDSLVPIGVFIIISPLYAFIISKIMMKNKKKKYEIQLKNYLVRLSGCVMAGSSLKVGIIESIRDMEKEGAKDELIMNDLRSIRMKIYSKEPMDNILKEWAELRNDKYLTMLVEVLRYSNRTGGRLIDAINNAISNIEDQINTERDIDAIIQGKRYEGIIMAIVPMAIMIFIRISNGAYFDALYHNPVGIIIMTVFLLVYLGIVAAMVFIGIIKV